MVNASEIKLICSVIFFRNINLSRFIFRQHMLNHLANDVRLRIKRTRTPATSSSLVKVL